MLKQYEIIILTLWGYVWSIHSCGHYEVLRCWINLWFKINFTIEHCEAHTCTHTTISFCDPAMGGMKAQIIYTYVSNEEELYYPRSSNHDPILRYHSYFIGQDQRMIKHYISWIISSLIYNLWGTQSVIHIYDPFINAF